MRLDIGVSLPTTGEDVPDVVEAARTAERAGFDSVWVGDHLADGRPILESTVALAAAAAVTERVRLGFGVLQLALRHPAWAAKQIGSLQTLSRGRLVLGVGAGGDTPLEWAAAGVPVAERGARTDRALAALPDLLAGKGEPRLLPEAGMPPVWIGGGSDAALRRAGRHGDGWLAAATPPEEIRGAAGRLGSYAREYGREVPQTGCLVIVAAGGRADDLAGFLTARLGLTPERAAATAVAGEPSELAGRLARYLDAGVRQLVLVPFGGDWRTQYELLAQAREALVS
ncbi:LLM class flavin-dependent oxidoreductase [Streptomyces acidiscabies]|uniref:LLM class flavin-dependent oxidoreductase n=1 Tax=Streptomyces acidiscabies TaxID=42234 RepID=UPI00076E9935|nr:LLM class flavin-dependent oxidoreductase [Streptomyces acidiscabies]GAQ53045.1 alkanesulfonate monooxygenase [Streptomyces acidiscabies]